MYYRALTEFLMVLEKHGELCRITRPVDPHLEITEIAVRAVREQKPALLFENVKGSRYSLAINVYASEKRIELALGTHPEQLGEEILQYVERFNPPTLKTLWHERRFLKRLISIRPHFVSGGVAQEVVEKKPTLSDLPIQTCWPKDGGKFITQGQVITYHPRTWRRNVGVYRMHVFDERTTGMHWQIQKGGGFHFSVAENLNQSLEVAVALGTSPALYFASVAALPEDIDEVIFASFLQNRPVSMTCAKTLSIHVPADAEIILEGIVSPHMRRLEGPFGDHFGHYSTVAEFPVFQLTAITHRRSPIYPATVVGIPPMEDKFVGDATQQILSPLIKVFFHEVNKIWAYYEAGFHNLLVAAVNVRYKKEAMKTACGILGMGQLSLTKCLILVSSSIDPRNWRSVLREIRDNFIPECDLTFLSHVPIDTLDFTSGTSELGSKIIIDATRKLYRQPIHRERKKLSNLEQKVRELDSRITAARCMEDCMLIVQCEKDGRSIVETLVSHPELQGCPIVVAVSSDINVNDDENVLWGIFTRFDCTRDIVVTEKMFVGCMPVYKGVLGIDATLKQGYPEPLKMDPNVIQRVNEYWDSLWKNR
ncbi:MAG: UbiD family decarboxylase [Bacteroidetes bacterium]|nr:UbiD family decarboxylase [Bacteroidota bacterium]